MQDFRNCPSFFVWCLFQFCSVFGCVHVCSCMINLSYKVFRHCFLCNVLAALLQSCIQHFLVVSTMSIRYGNRPSWNKHTLRWNGCGLAALEQSPIEPWGADFLPNTLRGFKQVANASISRLGRGRKTQSSECAEAWRLISFACRKSRASFIVVES